MTEDEDFFDLNITIGGEPVEKIRIEIPRKCPHCHKEVKKADTLCPHCWMPLDANADKD